MLSRLSRITNAQVGLLLLIFAIAGFGGSAFAHIKNIPNAVDATQVIDWWAWLDGALQNFSTEVVGAILTFGLIEVLVGSRKEQDERIARLVKEAGSSDNVTAKNAVNELRTLQMLTTHEGVLHRAILLEANLSGAILGGVNLSGANLEGANLSGANLESATLERANLWLANLEGADLMDATLEGADLDSANLSGTHLWRATLEGADLRSANLSGSNLLGANLSRANLRSANLSGAKLRDVNLSGADLRRANLEGAIINKTTNLDKATILPDANDIGDWLNPKFDKHWTPDTDMSRYTDPNHPDFWQPDWAKPDNTD